MRLNIKQCMNVEANESSDAQAHESNAHGMHCMVAAALFVFRQYTHTTKHEMKVHYIWIMQKTIAPLHAFAYNELVK